MNARYQARTGAQIADGLRLLADVVERDGTPERDFPEQAIAISYGVSTPIAVMDFAAKHGLSLTQPDGSATVWADLPLGEGVDKPERGYTAAYSGAVLLRVVYVPDGDES